MTPFAPAKPAPNPIKSWDCWGAEAPQGCLPKSFYSSPTSINTGLPLPAQGTGITVLPLGGTISSTASPDGKIPGLSFRQILERAFGSDFKRLPDLYLSQPGSRKFFAWAPRDSSEFSFPDAMTMVDRLYYHCQVAKGVLVTCGTDRMADMMIAASLMLQFFKIPIVFTGSQRILEDQDSDVKKNIADSLLALRSLPPGIFLVFGGRVIEGFKAVKLSTTSLDAFRSFDLNDYAVVDAEKGIFRKNYLLKTESPQWQKFYQHCDAHEVRTDYRHEQRVDSINLEMGYPVDMMEARLADPHSKAVVIRIPGTSGLSAKYADVCSRYSSKKPIIAVTRCATGITKLNEYNIGVQAIQAGVIDAGDVSGDAAVLMLKWIMGDQQDIDRIRQAFAYRHDQGSIWSRTAVSLTPWCKNDYYQQMVAQKYIKEGDPRFNRPGEMMMWQDVPGAFSSFDRNPW